MELIDIDRLNSELTIMNPDFHSKRPFHYVVIENFFNVSKAEEIFAAYPTIENGKWDGTTYIDQQNKFQMTEFQPGSLMARIFDELNSEAFVKWLENLSHIGEIIADDSLLGGGLHQSRKGAFLNVHIDYNIHDSTKYHRRLNVLVYMNKGWKDEYEGHLELWDMSEGEGKLIDRIAPNFNRCVIFETNEVSFHGHPKPLKTPPDISRKSIATYYYTKTRPSNEIAPEHNTLYVNTEGKRGQIRRFSSGIKALLERINKGR